MPAFNEATVIEGTLRRAREVLEQHEHELIVVDAGDDDTGRLAARYARVVRGGPTRGTGLNRAAALATGEVLLFLHADTLLPAGAAEAIAAALADGGVAGGAFRLQLDDPGRPARLVAFGVNLRSRLLGSFFGDQALFVRRDVFLSAGGFREWSVMEDLEILSRLGHRGRLVVLDLPVTTSARRHRQRGWLRTVALVWTIGLLYRVGVSAERLARLYPPQR